MTYEEKTISKRHIYTGGIIDVESHTVVLPNGKEATRDIVLHAGASAVVPMNEKGEIAMVSQYRKPIERVSLEIPAGKLDAGEDPETCAVRELKEETGLSAGRIKHMLSIHSTPGFSNEVLHIYGATDLKQGETCADEDEFLSVEWHPIGKLVQMIQTGQITDAKSIVGILLADRIIKGELSL